MPAPRKRDAEELADIIMGLDRALLSELAQLSGERVSLAQLHVLGFLDAGDLGMSQLAQKMGHSQAATTGMVDRLVEAGFIARVEDPADRRRVTAHITHAGRNIVDELKRHMVENILKIFDIVGEQDCAAWLRVYRKIHELKESHAFSR